MKHGALMRLCILPSVVVLALALAACQSSPEPQGEGPRDMRPPSAPSRSQWNAYLRSMSENERLEFLAIQDDTARMQWLRRTGIDVRTDLDGRLARGLTVADARARIPEKPEDISRDGTTTMLFYSRFNTQSRTNFYLLFEADQLVSWNSFTLEKQERQKSLLDYEARLMKKFNIMLRRGMGMNAIRRQAENAQADENSARIAVSETLQGSRNRTYRGAGQATFSDYVVAESLLYAKDRNELYSWFLNRQPDKVVSQQPYERHLYYVPHRDARGNDATVIVELVFLNGQLEAWYVFHEE